MALLPELRGALTAFALVICGVMVLASVDLGIPGQAALQSLRFHFAAVLLALVILHLITGAWWRGLVFLIAFALSVGQGGLVILRQQQARAVVASLPSKPLLRMLSFNVLQSNTGSGRELATFIERSGADIALIMEGGPVKPFAAEIAETYPYNSGCAPQGPCDMFLLSRTPLTDVSISSLSHVWENRLVAARTIIDGEPITVVGAHMAKPYFDDTAEEEADRIGGYIRSIEGPLVLAGDFNAAGWSQNIDRLARVQGLIPGPSYPATWPIRLGPFGVPIDNMWTRAPLIISSIRALEDPMGSNHRGIIAELSLAQGASAAPAAAPAQ